MGVCVLGSLNLDIVCRVAALPLPGETILGTSVERLPGGKGANQAIAAARHGVKTSLIGAVGADEAGVGLLTHLHQAGVGVGTVASLPGQPTGQAYITVSAGGQNTIVVIGGANAALTPAHITPQALADSSVFLSQFETPFETIRAVFSSPEAKAGITILNAAPAVDGGEALFPLADILVLNQTELARYAGGEEAATLETATVAARRLILRPDQRVVATLGAAGAAAVGPDSAFLVRGRAARVVDTSGAGDCFCGVLAAALAEGQDLRAAMTIANAAAALSTERHGAGLSAPTRAETEAALASA